MNCWRAILSLGLLGGEWHLLITFKPTNQRARKAPLNCVVCTKRQRKLSWVLYRITRFFPWVLSQFLLLIPEKCLLARNFFFSAAVKFDFNIGNSNCKTILKKKKKKEGRKLNCWRAILFLWLLGSEWHLLITSKSANQRARKVLLNCMVCTKRWSKLSGVLDRMLSFFPESFDKDHSFYFVIVAIVTDTFVPSIFMTIVHPPPPQPSSGVTWQ